MKESRKSIERIMQTELTRVSDSELDGIGERMLHKLHHSNPSDILDDSGKGSAPMKASRTRWQPVAAAVLIGIAGLGLYAAQRSGFFSPRRVAPPTAPSPAPSEKAVAETAQVAAVPPGTTKPAEGLSREGIFAAQTAAAQATDAGAKRLQFATASIRRQPMAESDHNIPGTFNCRGVDGLVFSAAHALPAPQGRCLVDKQSMDSIISMAFQTSRMSPWMGPEQTVVGIPENLRVGPFFQIQAVAENPASATKAELLQMFQNLLMDRFKLRIRREIRQVDGYVVTVAPSGIKFKETSEPEQRMLGTGPQALVGNITMEGLARFLEGFLLPSLTGQQFMRPAGAGGPFPLHIPVDDKTALKGVYAIRVNTRRTALPGLGAGGGGGRSGGDGSRTEYDPPLPKAFEEQLGLVLTRGKVPVEYIIVEHIEAPSEN